MNPRKPRRSRMNQTSSSDHSAETPTDNQFVRTMSSEESFRVNSPPLQISPRRKEPMRSSFHLTKTQFDEIAHRQAEKTIDESFGSSMSESISVIRLRNQRKHVSEGVASHARASPAVMRHSLQEGETFDLPSTKPKRFSQMGFSFKPGDDTDLASLAGKRIQRQRAGDIHTKGMLTYPYRNRRCDLQRSAKGQIILEHTSTTSSRSSKVSGQNLYLTATRTRLPGNHR